MKTISCYRQTAVNKKPKNHFLIALAIAVAFIAGALVGNTTPIIQDVAAAGGAGVEHLRALYQGSVARDVPRLVESVRNMAEFSLTGLEQDSEYATIGP